MTYDKMSSQNVNMSQQYRNGKYLANVHMPDLSNTKYE